MISIGMIFLNVFPLLPLMEINFIKVMFNVTKPVADLNFNSFSRLRKKEIIKKSAFLSECFAFQEMVKHTVIVRY